jgi:hypothetical protein
LNPGALTAVIDTPPGVPSKRCSDRPIGFWLGSMRTFSASRSDPGSSFASALSMHVSPFADGACHFFDCFALNPLIMAPLGDGMTCCSGQLGSDRID